MKYVLAVLMMLSVPAWSQWADKKDNDNVFSFDLWKLIPGELPDSLNKKTAPIIKEKPVLVFAGSGMTPMVECQDRDDCVEEAKNLLRHALKSLESEKIDRVYLGKRQL